MKVIFAVSEAVPFAKTGGLADVAGALVKEYRKMNIEAYLMLPLYSRIKDRFDIADTGLRLNVALGGREFSGKLWLYGSYAYFIECSEFFERPELYGTPYGDYPDNAARFIFFDMAVLEACMALGLRPDVIHCNDWQTGLIPLYLKTLYHNDFFSLTGAVMTVHNLGYQGIFDVSDYHLTGFGLEWFNPEGVEFYGKVNFLKAGLISSDIITTVSSTYSKEILTAEHGHGLDGILRKKSSDLHGVINGIDTEEWNPMTDNFIPARYDSSDISGKAVCKKGLVDECSLHTAGRESPVIAVVGRLSTQKGLQLIIDSANDIISKGFKLIFLGKGDEQFHFALYDISKRHKGSVFVKIGYDEPFAHRIYAGSDIFLIPSRYEPCGLGQVIAMRYGTIPVARKTGGLADTIIGYDAVKKNGTGFLFKDYNKSALKKCLGHALSVYEDKEAWGRMIAGAMQMDFSWKKSAERYIELYMEAINKKERNKGLV